ncbi:MAG: NAD-dependent epimerase/dehydratase family protein [Rhodothermaceae bacterium]|nr:NAD-dependent epimerase/dehydratase family protein [Rhodothermaceae bacterium]
MKRILVTGANGQIGSDLVSILRDRHGAESIIGADLALPKDDMLSGPHIIMDITDREHVERTFAEFEIDAIFHLASLLSAKGEQVPDQTWDVNLNGLKYVLDCAVKHTVKVFWPSSIAVFGSETPKEHTPQYTILEPSTMYGVTKRAGELLCSYYHRKFGLDVRSVRYPGLISFTAPPGGGTTDFSIEMLRAAAEGTPYTCFVSEETRLPMMYMPDAVQAVLDIMNAPANGLSVRTSYNITAFSFSAKELEEEIKTIMPTFSCTYEPDYRNGIAATWPSTIDDSVARKDWNWNPAYNLTAMVKDMISKLKPVPSV